MSSVDILVIGGGPTGLGAAWQLARHPSIEWLLCEADTVLGGLSRSYVDHAGYTWDIGGHVCFSHYDMFDDVIEATLGREGMFEHRREAWIRLAGKWVPYPFQINLHRLAPADRLRCLSGLTAAWASSRLRAPRPRDFGGFIDATFGRGISRMFMRPYNEKVWAHPLELMSYDWIGERVAVCSPAEAIRATVGGKDASSWGPNSTFRFPKAGGTGAFWAAIGRSLPKDRVRTSARACAIDASRRRVEFEDGSVVEYRNLITTAPLDVTAAMLDDSALIEQTARLGHSAVHVIGLGVEGAVGSRLGTTCWAYFPDPRVPFYRVTNFSHYSPAHVPAGSGTSSLLVEVSESVHRRVDAERLAEDVIAGLVTSGVLDDPDQVLHTWTHRVEHGYPTPTLQRDAIVGPALVGLESAGILSRGRFGAWRYEVGNMDHSFAQGYEAAARVLTGSPELTLWEPGIVNTGHRTLGWGRLR